MILGLIVVGKTDAIAKQTKWAFRDDAGIQKFKSTRGRVSGVGKFRFTSGDPFFVNGDKIFAMKKNLAADFEDAFDLLPQPKWQVANGSNIGGNIVANPAIAAAKYEDDDVASDTAENVGNDLGEAVNEVMADYLNIPPTISVSQGAVVMVRVDADIEFCP